MNVKTELEALWEEVCDFGCNEALAEEYMELNGVLMDLLCIKEEIYYLRNGESRDQTQYPRQNSKLDPIMRALVIGHYLGRQNIYPTDWVTKHRGLHPYLKSLVGQSVEELQEEQRLEEEERQEILKSLD